MEIGKETIQGDKLSPTANNTSRVVGERRSKKLIKGVPFSLNKCSQNAKDAKLHKNHKSESLK